MLHKIGILVEFMIRAPKEPDRTINSISKQLIHSRLSTLKRLMGFQITVIPR